MLQLRNLSKISASNVTEQEAYPVRFSCWNRSQQFIKCEHNLNSSTDLYSVDLQVQHAAMIGCILDKIALCQLPNQVTLPPEVQGRSRPSTRTGRVKTPTKSGKERTEENDAENVGAILDEAMRHMKLAKDFAGM